MDSTLVLPQLQEPEFFPECWKSLLQGVVAFVDVRTGSDNRSKSIANEMEKLGALVVTHFSRKVTHVIFKDGSKPIYDKAKVLGIPIVSYLWIVACKEKGEIVLVQDYPAISSQDYDSPFFKWRKTKSMQPKELDEELKIVERKLDRRRKKLRQSILLEEKDLSSSEKFFSPAIPKSRKSIIDTLIESSPMVQERIQQELASGKSCSEVFTLNEGEEDDFDTFFDTPLMIKFIAKNYYSPYEPPPKSVKKMLSEIPTPRSSRTEDRRKSVLTESNRNLEDDKPCAFISPLNSNNGSGSKRKKRQSVIPTAKKRKENENEEKVPRRKLLFQPKHANFPEEPAVAHTPDETPLKIRNHPCFSQTEVKSRPIQRQLLNLTPEKDPVDNHACFSQTEVKCRRSRRISRQLCSANSPELIVRRISPRRDSLADFSLAALKKRPVNNLLKPIKEQLPSLVCTSAHSDSAEMVENAVNLLKGFRIIECVDDTTTHVICGDERRTLNVMRGIVRGVKFVSFQWVEDSIKEGYWLSEDSYPIGRFSACRKTNIFENFSIMYISPKSTVPFQDLSDIVKCAGGKLVNSSKKAELIIGVWKGDTSAPCVSGKWILDCVEKGCLLSFDEYVLTS